MPEYLTPGVYFEFRDVAPPVIRGIRTDITGFVGLAERGPLNEPVRIESWRQFQSQFGSFVPYSYLAYAVKGFFENGGRTCFIVRIAGTTAEKAKLILTKNDFLGNPDPLATEKKGLSAFDRVDAVGIVCIPDIHIQPVAEPPKAPPEEEPPRDPCIHPRPSQTPVHLKDLDRLERPPVFSEDEILNVQRAMIEHCEQHKDRVAILDTPVKPGGRSFTFSEVREWRNKFDSERGFAALYYPWIKVVDPLHHITGSPVRAIPPCGHIAGLYARSDFTVGVHKAPANEELFWAEDVPVEVNEGVQGILNPDGINCLRPFPGRGIRVYGARTLSSNPDWRFINVRRLLLMIEEAIDESTQWAVFEPNDFRLRQLVILSISSFLETLWRQGALVGAAKEDAFYVKCDKTNNPQEIVDQGKFIVEIGVAPTIPAEFIVFRIGRTMEEFEMVER